MSIQDLANDLHSTLTIDKDKSMAPRVDFLQSNGQQQTTIFGDALDEPPNNIDSLNHTSANVKQSEDFKTCTLKVTSSGDKSDQPAKSNSSSAWPKYNFLCDDTVQPLRPDQIHWFYNHDSKSKSWTPFIGYDSIRIETKYRELLYHAEREDEPKTTLEDEEGANADDRERVIVRGGLYEVDVAKRRCYSIYWTNPNEETVVRRGTWFKPNSWMPLEESLSDDIEKEHLSNFLDAKLAEEEQATNEKNKKKTAIHSLQLADCQVEWYSPTDVHLFYDTTTLYIRQKLGMQKVGQRIHRGHCTEARMDDKPPDITHLCFVVHGIGQKMHEGAIVKSCEDLRNAAEQVKRRHFTHCPTRRVEFLPVEWRTSLRLDGDTLDSITPSHIRGMRTLLNSSFMDIMYYTSPLYRSEIIKGLHTELNRLYSMFCCRNPYFESSGGQVSVVAHSLGSVITYDILMAAESPSPPTSTLNSPLMSPTLPNRVVDANSLKIIADLEKARQKVNYLERQLLGFSEKDQDSNSSSSEYTFRIDYLFCLGSPLAVFLALHGIRSCGTGTLDHIIPRSKCKRLFNIYHPADPVAYRIEPLILKFYSTIEPLKIHRYDASDPERYENMPRIPIVKKGSKPIPTTKQKIEDDFPSIQSLRQDSECSQTIDCAEIKIEDDEDDEDVKEATAGLTNYLPSLSTFISRFRATESPSPPSSRRQTSTPGSSTPVQFSLDNSADNQIIRSSVNYLQPPNLHHRELQTFSVSRSSSNDQIGPPSTTSDELMEAAYRKLNVSPSPSFAQSLPSVSRLPSQSPSEVSLSTHSSTNQRGSFIDQTELEHRVDFQLRESRYENTYLAVFTAHTSYWYNQDLARFILTQILPPPPLSESKP